MTVLDLVGIGAGPANLSLAALAAPLPNFGTRFFEKQSLIRWHPGMMLPESTLQVSHLKDLVTLVDPTSPYTFLNFLARTGRIHRFAAMSRRAISRLEFQSYYRWVSAHLPNVELGCEVRSVTFEAPHFRLETAVGTVASRHIAVGVGPTPHVPDCVVGHHGPNLFHSSQFLDKAEQVANRSIIVIGGGQSGAEIIAHLLSNKQRIRGLTWINRRPGFPQMDDSAFTNEWFQPDYVRHFHRLHANRRRSLLDVQKLASDGVSADLLERIYHRLYVNDFQDEQPIPYALLPGRELIKIEPAAQGGWRIALRHCDNGVIERMEGDVIVLATGYGFRLPACLDALRDRIPVVSPADPVLSEDYSSPWAGPNENKIFMLNAGRASHGVADPNLSLGAWRSAEILRSLGALPKETQRRTSANRWSPIPFNGSLNPQQTRFHKQGLNMGAPFNILVPSNPTPNGNLHIGHIAGPYVGVDILRRAALARGERAAIVLGTAWQQTHVVLAARRLNRDYLEVAADYARQIESSFADVNIEYDVMLRHGDAADIERAARFAFERLSESGAVSIKEGHANYCASCKDWRLQGFVAGCCPHCGSPDASGVDCEGCALYHDDAELLNPTCSVCGSATELRPLQRAFLNLESMRGWFEEYFESITLGSAVKLFAAKVLAAPLPDVAVTHPSEIGIAIDAPNLPSQRLFPAFELAPRYKVMLDRYWSVHESGLGSDTKTSMVFGLTTRSNERSCSRRFSEPSTRITSRIPMFFS